MALLAGIEPDRRHGPSARRLEASQRKFVRAALIACAVIVLVASPVQAVEDPNPISTRRYCFPPTEVNIACNCPKISCQCFFDEHDSVRVHGIVFFVTHCRGLEAVPSGIYPFTTNIILEGNLVSLDGFNNPDVNIGVVSVLNATRNRIAEIKNGTLRRLLSLDKIYLQHNSISNIESGAFARFSALQTLDLSYNRLTSLPNGLFADCKNLAKLYLSHNRLSVIPSHSLPFLSHLDTWFLDNNTIGPVVRQSDFSATPFLIYLNLMQNRIANLTSNIGEFPAPLLFTLILRLNNIVNISGGFFNELTELDTLDLSDNPLNGNGIGRYLLNDLVRLRHLDLSYTKLNRDTLHPYAFHPLRKLSVLSLSSCSYLTKLDGAVLWYQGCMLSSLDIRYTEFSELNEIGNNNAPTVYSTCQLKDIEGIGSQVSSLKWSEGFELCTICRKLEQIDFSWSQLSEIDNLQNCTALIDLLLMGAQFTSKSIEGIFYNHTTLDQINLSHNKKITQISDKVFGYMANLTILTLGFIPDLTYIHPEAFKGLVVLRFLDIQYVGIRHLPLGASNSGLAFLNITGSASIIDFPEALLLPNLEVASMNYAFHCCLFEVAAQRATAEVTTPPPIGTATTPLFVPITAGSSTGIHTGRIGFVGRHTAEEQAYKDRLFSSGNVERIPVYRASKEKDVELLCTPSATPFTPCLDMFAELWLRIAAWCVSLLAMGGNVTVLLVIIFGKHKMDNTRFLVLNLAIADLCLGIYLLILCVEDVSTRGEFSVKALDWQSSRQAQVAGFLAVFSTEMSFYTLMLITIERYVTIKLSMDIRYKFTRRRLYILACGGWLFACLLATLPLVGMSSYTNNILALPFDIGDVVDKAYVGFILLFNGMCIVVISVCYLGIWWQVRFSPAFSKKDNQIARRMALLVMVDLACWLPLAVLGLAATFGGNILVSLEASKIFAVFVFPLNSCANPFLYAIVTNHFQRDLIRILKAFPEKVGDLSRRRSSVLKTTPQPSDSKSFLHGIVQYVAREARRNLEGDPTSYNNNSSLPPSNSGLPGNGAGNHGHPFPFDARLAAASQLDAESSSEGNSSLMSPPGPGENCERRGTVVSYQASQVTDITDCEPPSEAGDAHTPTSTAGDLECSHRMPGTTFTTTGTAVLPEISEQSDRSSSSVSDGAHRVVPAPPGVGPMVAPAAVSPPSRIAGGLLMGALSAFSPILAGHTSTSAASRSGKQAAQQQAAKKTGPQAAAAAAAAAASAVSTAAASTPENLDETSGVTQSMILDKADLELMEKDIEPAGRTSAYHKAAKRSSASSSVTFRRGSASQQQGSPVPTSDVTPFCAGLIETSL